MSNESYTTAFTVDKSPGEVFAAINDVRSWWSGELDGETDRVGAEFTYRYGDLHDSKQRITELVPGRKVVWHVVDGYLRFVAKTDEWKGTEIVFDISEEAGTTEVRVTHVGLAPTCECYGACSSGWDAFLDGNLRRFIETGEVQPNPYEASARARRG
jgi:hypothetical protein